MNTDIFDGQFKKMEGAIKSHFAKLTDNDLGEAEGNTERLVGKLQARYGWAKEKAQAELESAVAKAKAESL
jgi:uncharacterized protein YjbJ (UPF0337 family)